MRSVNAGFARAVAVSGAAMVLWLHASVSQGLELDTGERMAVVDVDSDPLNESAPDALKASAGGSTLLLTSSAFAVVSPAQVTLTATVSGTALKGTITFKSGSTKIGAATINKNAAVVTLALPPAIHSVSVVYSGNDGDIVSPPLTVVVDNALTCG